MRRLRQSHREFYGNLGLKGHPHIPMNNSNLPHTLLIPTAIIQFYSVPLEPLLNATFPSTYPYPSASASHLFSQRLNGTLSQISFARLQKPHPPLGLVYWNLDGETIRYISRPQALTTIQILMSNSKITATTFKYPASRRQTIRTLLPIHPHPVTVDSSRH